MTRTQTTKSSENGRNWVVERTELSYKSNAENGFTHYITLLCNEPNYVKHIEHFYEIIIRYHHFYRVHFFEHTFPLAIIIFFFSPLVGNYALFHVFVNLVCIQIWIVCSIPRVINCCNGFSMGVIVCVVYLCFEPIKYGCGHPFGCIIMQVNASLQFNRNYIYAGCIKKERINYHR